MKRNMVPLLAIAFVVAIISTGIFYGLFAGKLRSSSDIRGHSVVVAARDLTRGTVVQASDLRISGASEVLTGSFSKLEEAVGGTLLTPLKANEPLLLERVVTRISSVSGGGMVPSGMRAISTRVSQSDGLLSLLRQGARVDLQAILERENRVELRNILQNVEVLAVIPPDPNANHSTPAIVTVLTQARDEDLLALSDAGGKIRVTLRNPFDEGVTMHHDMTFASVFSSQKISALEEESEPRPAAPGTAAATTDDWDHPIQLHVEVLAVSDAAIQEFGVEMLGAGTDAVWRVGSFRPGPGEDAPKLVHSLQRKHELDVVSSERLIAGVGRPITYRAGAAPYRLRIQFSLEVEPNGTVGVRVRPEVSMSNGAGVATREYDAGLASNSSFLVEGLSKDQAPEHLFPGRSWEQRRLVIFVTTHPLQPNTTVATAPARRGH